MTEHTSCLPGVAALPRYDKAVRRSPLWEDAKRGSYGAAVRVVDAFWSAEHTRQLQERLLPGTRPVFLAVPSTTGRNQIPEALARRLARECGGEYANSAALFPALNHVPMLRIPRTRRILDVREYAVADPHALKALEHAQIVVTEDIVSSGSSLKQFIAALRARGLRVQTHVQMIGTVALDPAPELVLKLRRALEDAHAAGSMTPQYITAECITAGSITTGSITAGSITAECITARRITAEGMAQRMAGHYTEPEIKKILTRLRTGDAEECKELTAAIARRLGGVPRAPSAPEQVTAVEATRSAGNAECTPVSEALPATFHGYPTAELLRIWDAIPFNGPDTPPVPAAAMRALRLLLRDYALTDFVGEAGEDPHKVLRVRRLLAPFGCDAAPWADDNGAYREDLASAFAEKVKAREAQLPDYDADFYTEDGRRKA